MKILLINPPRFENIPVIREERCEITERSSILEPYSLLQIGALLREDNHHIELIDANGFYLNFNSISTKIKKGFDAIIFRFTPTTFDHDLKVASIAKSINNNILTIGICFTLNTLSKEVMTDAKDLDIYLRKDYETVIKEIFKQELSSVKGITYRKGSKIIINPDAEPIKDYDSMPMPAYDLLPSLKPYFINTPAGQPFTIMYSSRGCPFRCIYCTVAGTPARMRSAESVLNEIKFLKKKYNIKTISFFDETFTLDKKRVIDICDDIKDMNITWYCNTRANLVDLTLLKRMYSAGCKGISFGIESGSETILKNISKGITVVQQAEGIRLAKKARIKVYCSFIFGLPGETKKTINETIKFVSKTLPTSAQFNVAVPYPGTKLYELAKEKGWITKLDWKSLYQHSSLMKNENLTPKELEEARKKAYRSLYFNPAWILQNVLHVIREPSDFILAYKYVLKILKNYIWYGMKHAH